MTPHLTATPSYYCDHCTRLAQFEVTSHEENEPTEPEPYTEHSVLACAACLAVVVDSARRWHGDSAPTVDHFEQHAVQVLAIAS